MNRKQNAPKYGNIAQLRLPGINFCVHHTEDAFQAHEPNSPNKAVLIPLLNEQEAKILPNREISHNSVRPWLIFVFPAQRTHFRHMNPIPQKNPHSFHF
jgi:hypothetical protein